MFETEMRDHLVSLNAFNPLAKTFGSEQPCNFLGAADAGGNRLKSAAISRDFIVRPNVV